VSDDTGFEKPIVVQCSKYRAHSAAGSGEGRALD
jgi:hypothetical protein